MRVRNRRKERVSVCHYSVFSHIDARDPATNVTTRPRKYTGRTVVEYINKNQFQHKEEVNSREDKRMEMGSLYSGNVWMETHIRKRKLLIDLNVNNIETSYRLDKQYC